MATGLVEVRNQDDAFAGVTYVVVDEDDDLASLHTKLEAVAGRRVALVVPKRAKVLDNPAAMHIVARIAAREGVRLAIVSPRARTRHLAEIERLPSFAAVSGIPRYIREARSNPLEPFGDLVGEFFSYLRTELSWLCAIFLVFGIIAFAALIIPHAVVTVHPVTEQLNGALKVVATVDASAIDPAKGGMPGRQVYLLVTASDSIDVPADGRPLDGYAVGYVTFTNRTKDKLTVPKGTDVSTYNNLHYLTLDNVTLDAREGTTAQARIRAQQPGPGGNLKADNILVVNGPMNWMLSVVNDVDTAGGGASGVPVVTAWEQKQLVDATTAQAQTRAREQLASQTTSGELVVPESVQVTPIVQNFDHRVGDAASRLTVQMQFRASAMIVNQDQIRSLAVQMWHPTIQSGFAVRTGSVRVDPASVTGVTPGTVTFSVPIHAVLFKTVNPDRIADYVRLRSPDTAIRDLNQLFDFAAPPAMTVTPNWIGRAYRVDVIVDTSATPEPPTEPQQSNASSDSSSTPNGGAGSSLLSGSSSAAR